MRFEYYKIYIIICNNNSNAIKYFTNLITNIDHKYIKEYSTNKLEIKFRNGYILQFVSRHVIQKPQFLQGRKFGLLLFESTVEGAITLFLEEQKKTVRKLLKLIDNAILAKCKYDYRFEVNGTFDPNSIEDYKDYHSKFGCPNPELWANHTI